VARTKKPARAAMKIFETLYSLYGRIDAKLNASSWFSRWHPQLAPRRRQHLPSHSPPAPAASVQCRRTRIHSLEADHPVELYSALFQSMTDVDGRAIGRCCEELEQEGFHPLINCATSGFLKRLVVQLSRAASCSRTAHLPVKRMIHKSGVTRFCSCAPAPWVFAAAIEGILADLRTREDLPWSLLNIVGEESPLPDTGETDPSPIVTAKPMREFFSANPRTPNRFALPSNLRNTVAFWFKAPRARERRTRSEISLVTCWPKGKASLSPAIPQKRCAWCAITLFPSCVLCASAFLKATWTAANNWKARSLHCGKIVARRCGFARNRMEEIGSRAR